VAWLEDENSKCDTDLTDLKTAFEASQARHQEPRPACLFAFTILKAPLCRPGVTQLFDLLWWMQIDGMALQGLCAMWQQDKIGAHLPSSLKAPLLVTPMMFAAKCDN
jgi:hypothetical protein